MKGDNDLWQKNIYRDKGDARPQSLHLGGQVIFQGDQLLCLAVSATSGYRKHDRWEDVSPEV